MTVKDLNLSLDQALLQSWSSDRAVSNLNAARARSRKPSAATKREPAPANSPLPEPIGSQERAMELAASHGRVWGVPPAEQAGAQVSPQAAQEAIERIGQAAAQAQGQQQQSATKTAPGSKKRSKKRAAPATGAARNNRQTVLIGFIAIMNMAFLVLAGIWLTGAFPQARLEAAPTPAVAPAAIQAMAADFDQRLAAMEQSLSSLGEALTVAPAAPSQDQPASSEVNAEPEPAAALPQWQVNLGQFTRHSDALAVQEQVKSAGFQATVSQPQGADKGSYQVALAGFGIRLDAEQAAGQIMEKTRLNGLWVGQAK